MNEEQILSLNKQCKFNSSKDCFLYVDSSLRNFGIDEKYVVCVEYGEKQRSYFSAIFYNTNSRPNGNPVTTSQIVTLNSVYAKKLRINENDEIKIVSVNKEGLTANSVTVEPVSANDWEILELNLDEVQNNLLNQIKVLYREQIFPIWVESQIYIFVRVVDFDPPTKQFTSLNSMTRLIIQPFHTKPTESSLSHSSITEFTFSTSRIKFNDARHSENLSRCSNSISTIKVSESFLLKKLAVSNLSRGDETYLVKIERVKSPIQAFKVPSSSASLMRKFLQSIDSSFSSDYLLNQDQFSKSSIYALMSVDEKETADCVEMPQFLRRQLSLFENGAAILISAESLSKHESQLSTTSKKKVLIKTNFNTDIENVKQSFIHFIDQNTECLCPIVLTNNMILELNYNEEIFLCSVCIDTDFICISSSLLLNDLLTISVEIKSVHQFKSVKLDSLSIKQFSIQILNSKWFDANVNEIVGHLDLNFNSFDLNSFPRNVMLYGLKGSGKSTLCKYVCNLVSRPPFNGLYFYINCQTFMNKTVDTIYDQLKFIYDECIWFKETNCLVVLENIDLLIENKSHTVDPSLMLYHAQIVECLKEIFNYVWSKKCRTVTLVSTNTPFNEMPSIFHSIDEHGLFSEFIRIKPHSVKEETIELINSLTQKRSLKFSRDLIEAIVSQTDGFVFKDLEKLIDQILFKNFSSLNYANNDEITNSQQSQETIYNYTCINMLETKFYKSRTKLNWRSMGGLDTVKQKLIEYLIWPIKYKHLYKKLLMKQSGGVLLYGPSGCGKTLLASVLANESNFNFMSVKGPELLSKYIGSSEQNVRELFNKAEKAKPCIIFFDEFDALAPRRGHDSTGVTDRVVNQLLTQLDGVEMLDGVYLLAATSRPDLIDQALLRPGRLDNFLYIGYPSRTEVKEIFELYCSDMKLAHDVNLDELSVLCEEFTGADIKSVVCDSLLKAFHRVNDKLTSKDEELMRDSILIEHDDFLQSIDSIKQTINRKERLKLKRMYENWTQNRTFNETTQEREEIRLKATLA